MFKYSFFRYGFIGVLSVIIDFLIIYILFHILNTHKNIAISLGFIISSIFNFYMHSKFTFQQQKINKSQIIKYILTIIISYFITIVMVNFFMQYGVNIYLSKLLVLIIIYIYGYLFGKYFIFKKNS